MNENLPTRSMDDPRPMSDGEPTEWIEAIDAATIYMNAALHLECNDERITRLKWAIEQLEGAIIELQQPVYGPTEPEWDEEGN